MRKYATTLTLMCCILCIHPAIAQPKLWTEEDRRYLVTNLKRTADSIISSTKSLSPAQWNFKEADTTWSINQVIEHLAIYELLYQREISQAMSRGPQPELTTILRPDSVYLKFIYEETRHITTDYTKPFSYTVPMGLNPGKNNVTWFLKMRNESIQFVDTTTLDLRTYFLNPQARSAHQRFLGMFSHVERHLRQIQRIKKHKNYPKK